MATTVELARELKLKAELLTEGVTAEAEAIEGLGKEYKEQCHGLFGWDFENHVGQTLPDDFRLLPGGTVVQFRQNSKSRFCVSKTADGLVLREANEVLCRVEWLPRPAFYERTTTDGTPMTKVAQIGGEDSFFVCYNNYCSHWQNGKQCLFCNLVTTKQTYRSVLTRKKLNQIGETAAAAFSEGVVRHCLLTGGCFPGENETDLVVEILHTLRNYLGVSDVPGCVLASPPRDLREIERIREAGITGIGYSLEIWNRDMFKAICPGKEEHPGYEKFLDSLEYAVGIFGRGNVFCALVTGIEPREYLLEGVEYLAAKGITSLCFIWSPVPGSRLEGHRNPTAEWYLNTTRRVVDIFEKNALPLNENIHCYRCDGNTLFHDEARLRSLSSATNKTAG
ncbi:MAG: radical SAM protein [Clostridia bacterium]|nr:MAG: radical SAM protein [Clostridia bacterium]